MDERQPLLAVPTVIRRHTSRSAVSEYGSVISDYEDYPIDGPWYGATAPMKNTGSHARDYCALERTFLSHIRFGLVLFALTTSFLCRVRFPTPGKRIPLPDRITLIGDVTMPLGDAYAGATLLVLSAGYVYYERSYRTFRLKRGFVGGDSRLYEIMMGAVALLVLATALLLFFDSSVLASQPNHSTQ